MHKDNLQLRQYLNDRKVFQWELAKYLEMDETVFCKELRYPLGSKNLARYKSIVDKISATKR